MTTTSKFILLTGLLISAVAPTLVEAQSFDTSGTASLSGQYLFRYVTFLNSFSSIQESCSLTGVLTFDGKGKYTISSSAQFFDSAGSSGGSCASLGGGAYGVQPNGILQMDNPFFSATLYGSFTQPVIMASSTEEFYMDTFVAVQAPAASASNSLLSGAYTVGTLDFLDASVSLAREGFFTLNADGKGNIAAFTFNGSAANLNNTTQSVGSSTYALAGAGGGTVTFPGSAGDQTQLLSGAKTLYVSADGNFLIGGMSGGTDLIFGFRGSSGSASNALLNGTYFIAGMDANASGSPALDAFYGSINANGAGQLIWHQRFDDVVDNYAQDETFDLPVTIASDGSYYDGTYNYFAGANGTGFMIVGSGAQFSLNFGVHAPSYTSSSVWIDPVGITNAAIFTPITSAYAPGELVTIFGNFSGVSTQVDSQIPIPTQLGGVQVFVNGTAAPVYSVTSSQISAFVPYELSGQSFATFQVDVNGTKSNSVTVYADASSPGIYTLTQNGIGQGAILHADYTDVTDSSPAKPGDTVQLFMNGLGTVTPTVADGEPGGTNPLSYSDEFSACGGSSNCLFAIVLYDSAGNQAQADIAYAGLAPGIAGLYQVNFTIPSTGLTNGDVGIVLYTDEGYTNMATIALSGFSQSSAPLVSRRHAPPLRSPLHQKALQVSRRALPPRS
jgi:uncharacterized protein (TIGR03437 family)